MKKTFLLTGTLILLGIVSCKKNTEVDEQNFEGLTETQDSLFSMLPSIIPPINTLKLPGGLNLDSFMILNDPQFHSQWSRVSSIDLKYAKNIFIGRMFMVASKYINRSNYIKSAGNDATIEPAQHGLAYAWGSRNPDQRYLHTTGPNPTQCPERIYGLDCSGMLIKELQNAGLNIPHNISTQQLSQADYINNLLAQSPDFKYLRYKDYSGVSGPSIGEAGDILCFGDNGHVTHIGLLSGNLNGKNYVYQSNGSYKLPKCEKNFNPSSTIDHRKGPRCVEQTNFLHPDWGFDFMKVLRLAEDFSAAIIDTWDITQVDNQTYTSGMWSTTSYMLFSGSVVTIRYSSNGSYSIKNESNNTPATCLNGTFRVDGNKLTLTNCSIPGTYFMEPLRFGSNTGLKLIQDVPAVNGSERKVYTLF
jgi:hypothetical protein